MPENESSSLLLILDNRLVLRILPSIRGTELSIDSFTFRLLSAANGFYDYLRNTNRGIIGLRFSAFQHEPILDYALPLSYAYVDKRRSYMEIYFCGGRGLVTTGDTEQAFGDDAFWRSEDGLYALQVGTADLTVEDLESLRKFAGK